MSRSVGPARLVLINSGKFDYGEVELGVPLHLVGPNNVGKTTLISTLQFLYIDNQNQMHFSRSMDETRKYYFPTVHSYVLFECLSPTGYMVLGVRGLGALKGNDFSRFIYTGQYSRDDYITPDGHVREWDEIRKDLGVRDYTELKKSADLQSTLTGIGAGKGMHLGLIPVRDRNGYAKFKTIFRNLLRLVHLNQQDLKMFLLEVNRQELLRTELDLAGDYSQQYKQIEKLVREYAELQANSAYALDLIGHDDERSGLRVELPGLRAALLASCLARMESLRRDIQDRERELEVVREELDTLGASRHALERKRGDLQKGIGVLEDRLARHESESERFQEYLAEMERGKIADLEDRASKTRMLLRDSTRESEEQVRTRLASAERDAEKLGKKLSNISRSVAAHWGELPEKTEWLFRILNEELLSLPEGPEGMEIFDKASLEKRLRALADGITEGKYRDSILSIDLRELSAPDLQSLHDRSKLEVTIAGLNSTIERDREVLEAIRKRQELENRLRELRSELDEGRRKYGEWERYNDDMGHAVEWKTELDALQEQEIEVSREWESLEDRRVELKELDAEHSRLIGSLQKDLRTYTDRKSGIPVLSPEWSEPGIEVKTEFEIEELFEKFNKAFNRERHLSDRISTGLRMIESGTYGRYSASDESNTLERLRDDISALDRKEEAVRKLWTALATELGQAFKALVEGLEMLKTKIGELNRQLAPVAISDLKRLRLNLTENHRWTDLLRKRIQADEMPLFTNRKSVEEALEQLGELLQSIPGGRLELIDLFSIGFEIHTADGSTRTFSKLESIESHGTTIAIKVLVNLMLLKGLLSRGDARIPFYLDEASSLDMENLSAVVKTAYGLGFPAILASPDAMAVAENLYYLKDVNGRVCLDPERSRVHLDRKYALLGEEPDADEAG